MTLADFMKMLAPKTKLIVFDNGACVKIVNTRKTIRGNISKRNIEMISPCIGGIKVILEDVTESHTNV